MEINMENELNDRHSDETTGQFLDFACPSCRSSLRATDQHLSCSSCSKTYPNDDGLFKFTVQDSNHGELSREEMHVLLNEARTNGWRSALDSLEGEDKVRLKKLITSPLRKNAISIIQECGDRVLDFGCGYGGVSLALAENFAQVVSLDGSEERVSMLNVMRQQEDRRNITPVCHIDALNLPFPDNCFDAIVLTGVFEYLPLSLPHLSIHEAHTKCLQSFLRILRPGGKLLLNTKNRFGWPYLLGGKDHTGLRFAPALPVRVADLILRMRGRGPYRIINYSLGGYQKLLHQAGFENIEMHSPYPSYQSPHAVFDLQTGLAIQIPDKPLAKNSRLKTETLRFLAKIGILRLILPHYSALGSKPVGGEK